MCLFVPDYIVLDFYHEPIVNEKLFIDIIKSREEKRMILQFSSRRKLAKQLRDLFEAEDSRIHLVQVKQKQPWTFAEVRFKPEPGRDDYMDGLTGVGFSKCRYPDVYDEGVGGMKAIQRAFDDLAYQLWDAVPF